MRAIVKRKSAPKRALIRRKRMARRPPGVYRFIRSQYYLGAVVGSTLTDTFGGIYFRLIDVPGSSEFTSLFDQYRIDKVRVRFMPRANSAEVGTNQGMVKLFTAIDYDDISPAASIQDLLQYQNCRFQPTTRMSSRTLKPKHAVEVYQSAVSTGYGMRTGWLDVANPSVQHYGIKWALQQLPAGAQTFDLHIQYHLSFKNVR